MRRSQNARTGTRAARTRCGLRKFDVSSVPATACGSFHLPQGASIRLSGWRGFRAGSGGLQSVPKISIFGTHILERPNSANAGFLRSHFRRVFGTGICCPRCVTPLARSATISRSDDIYRGGDGSVDLPALGLALALLRLYLFSLLVVSCAKETGAFPMLRAGKYSVWMRTPLAEGLGVVVLAPDGKLSGSDSVMTYTGHWRAEGEQFEATLSAVRHSTGPGAFGALDEIDVTLTGRAKGGITASCTGTAKQAPALTLEATLVRMEDG
jgi:hypothetical protein